MTLITWKYNSRKNADMTLYDGTVVEFVLEKAQNGSEYESLAILNVVAVTYNEFQQLSQVL